MAGVVVNTREGGERGGLTWFGVDEWGMVVVVLDDDGRGMGCGGGGWERKDGLRLNRASRFGQARAALSNGHAPTLYDQIKWKVRAPL
jgi:hypothetical protein